jgi:hypothetical protein
MKKVLTNNYFMIGVAVLLLLAGLYLSIHYETFQWLSRFGALVICVGIIVLARPAILDVDIKPHIIMAETNLSHLDHEHYKKLGEPVPNYVIEDDSSRKAVGYVGPWLCLLGTLANGFADLLNPFFFVDK